MTSYTNSNSHTPAAYVEILEQPMPTIRFRYESEGRTSSAILGARSTDANKTYTKIRIVGYTGKAVVVVSCVTDTKPYRPHPHKLLEKGKSSNPSGEYSVTCTGEDVTITFDKMGIQCVKRDDMSFALTNRKNKKIDPFKTGFSHNAKEKLNMINLNAVRLCFQVFTWIGEKIEPLQPVVSNPISKNNELKIEDISDETSPVTGGKKIMLFCDKIRRNDVRVQLLEKDSKGTIVWEESIDLNNKTMSVHRQAGISFRTPKYKSLDIDQPANVFLQLFRPSDETTSELIPFQYMPLESNQKQRKRKKGLGEGLEQMYAFFDSQEKENGQENQINIPLLDDFKVDRSAPAHNMNITTPATAAQPFKREPLHSMNRNHTYEYNQRQEMRSESYRNPYAGDQFFYPQPQYNTNIPSVLYPMQSNYVQYANNAYVNSSSMTYNQFQPMDMQGAVGICSSSNNENLSPQFNQQHPYLNTMPPHLQSYHQSFAQQNRSVQHQPQPAQQNFPFDNDAERDEPRQINTNELCEVVIEMADSASNDAQSVIMKSTPLHPDVSNITNNFNNLN